MKAKLFYEFCLEDRVPSNHLLRKIDRFVDLSELRAYTSILLEESPMIISGRNICGACTNIATR
jgi:hypothetical protein